MLDMAMDKEPGSELQAHFLDHAELLRDEINEIKEGER
jgi:hypothetical protein